MGSYFQSTKQEQKTKQNKKDKKQTPKPKFCFSEDIVLSATLEVSEVIQYIT